MTDAQSTLRDRAFRQDLFLPDLAQIVGEANILRGSDADAYVVDARRRYFGQALSVVRPGDTAQVAKVVALCAGHNVAVVPQGGNTGMCGAATPDPDIPSIVLSLERMTRLRDLDAANGTITVDAGCRLATIQQAASAADKLFPMSLGSEGSCQIGGNIATNAGGTAVLRYGPMRDLVLGLEAVLADGRTWDGLRGLRKDNTGYDLKQLFIGSEGTLGVITGAVLKLFPKPKTSVTALVGLDTIHAALDLLGDIRGAFGDRLSTFEVMSENEYALVLAHNSDLRDPLAQRSAWYTFIELTDSLTTIDLNTQLADHLAHLVALDRIRDATIADSIAQADNIWHIRHTVTEANLASGAGVSHDTSVPVSRVPDFVEACQRDISARFPDAKIYFVGHVGDGNIHVVAIFPHGAYPDAARFSALAAKVNAVVDEVTLSLNGSISAEHGIGISNRKRLEVSKDPVELGFMRQIKSMFDPAGIMNPGKLL